ncbi:MAG: altronate dehydratase [Armatimonadetes bacterium]|nr:altronate dehydratase [Armatimonadota bacterium]
MHLSEVAILLKPEDDVAVAKVPLPTGTRLVTKEGTVEVLHDVPAGHKVALRELKPGSPIHKYGQTIGFAVETIPPGAHVHTHNVAVRDFERDYAFASEAQPTDFFPQGEMLYFDGYQREDGRVGTRNYIAVVSTVNCSASVSRYIADRFRGDALSEYPNVDGIVAIKTPGGCATGVTEEEYHALQRVLAGYATHPNVGACVLVGLGCETNQAADLIENQGLLRLDQGRSTPRVLNIQDCGGIVKTVEAGVEAVKDLLPSVNGLERTQQPISELVLATQCGGSDGNSGITANPALGVASDLLVRYGGTSALAETPEIYGAEHLLTRRARSREVGQKLIDRIRWWEAYVAKFNSAINNNPTPGNKKGGLTTIYEKSLGAVAKGGTEVLNDVYLYAERIRERGFVFVDTPGYDPVSVTGLVASGCNIVVFTTGRGSVFGCKPVPSIKVATNTPMYERMIDDMDLNAGVILEGTSVEEVGRQILKEMIDTASGRKTKSELHGVGDEEFVPWPLGPTL